MRCASRVSHDRDTVRALVRRRKMNEEQRAADAHGRRRARAGRAKVAQMLEARKRVRAAQERASSISAL
jgi:hypothetical protein